MVRPSDFVDGVTIRWRPLAVTLVGAGTLAFFEGIIATILSLADAPIGLFAGFADWLGQLVTLFVGFPASRLWWGWQEAADFVADAGIAGLLVALAIVLTTLYIVAEVVSRVR
jgi:Zn-dependent membrane protease YugP